MKVINKDKTYEKESIDIKKAIDKSIQKLMNRLSPYLESGKKIQQIFGDDILIHDIIRDIWYVYKCQTNNVQIRILYTVEDNKVIVLSHFCKKRSNKEYIKYFETAVDRCIM